MSKLRLALFITLILAITTLISLASDRQKTPKVRYIEPKNDSVVDLKDKEYLVFRWKSTPIPSGGRLVYKFDLYKGFGYEALISEELEHKVFSVEVPRDEFEEGVIYSWQVKQRDARTRFWSMDNRWSFKVKK